MYLIIIINYEGKKRGPIPIVEGFHPFIKINKESNNGQIFMRPEKRVSMEGSKIIAPSKQRF